MSTLNWFKSTYSSSEGDSCVEVALTPSGAHVRDSKDTTRSPFTASSAAWSDFLTAVPTDR
ncbi:DUF397 domain-containing protein [Streptomyces sp. NPDC088925]|uniref:DUF397 domain-containing protein n=1 Tax=Streptomyces sp. NPDC088925 TaxID=3365914 RepID=UPI0037FE6618